MKLVSGRLMVLGSCVQIITLHYGCLILLQRHAQLRLWQITMRQSLGCRKKNIKKKGTSKGASANNSIAINVDDNSTQDEVGADHSSHYWRSLKRRGETIQSAQPPSITYDDLADSSDDEDFPFLHQDKDDPDWRNSEIFNDDDEDSEGDDYYRVPSARGGGAGRKSNPGQPPKPNTDGMSPEEAAAVIDKWRLDWKRQRDLHRRTAAAARGHPEDEDVDLDMSRFTGVCNPQFRTMGKVLLMNLQD